MVIRMSTDDNAETITQEMAHCRSYLIGDMPVKQTQRRSYERLNKFYPRASSLWPSFVVCIDIH